MTGIRSGAIRLVVFATSVAAFSLMFVITPSVFAQETTNGDEIRQASLDYLNSWVLKNGDSAASCQCEQCPRCSHPCKKTEATKLTSSPDQECSDDHAKWRKLWFLSETRNDTKPCKGENCSQPCDNSECMNGKLGMVGLITESNCSASCDAANCQAPCCQEVECSDCELCLDVRTMPEKSDYCQDMADLLCATLHGKDMDDPSMRIAIEKAMVLVARNAKSESLTAMAQQQAKHEKEKASMRGQLVQLSTQVHTVNDLRNWIGPLYTNQNRTIQHIQLMSASSNALNRTLNLLEKQLSSKRTTAPTAIKYANPHVVQDDSKSEVYDLKRQISQLKQQLQQMQRTQSNKIQPAQHLQPIFNSKQPLEPLDSPFPSTINWAPKTQRR